MPGAAKKDGSGSRSSGAGGGGARLDYPRAARLLRRSEFEAVYRSGRRRASRHFVVFCRPNHGEQSRFGISVKRALGGAVRRNRIRRRIREILRLCRGEFPTGWDIVIHPRSAVASGPFAELRAELVTIINEAARR